MNTWIRTSCALVCFFGALQSYADSTSLGTFGVLCEGGTSETQKLTLLLREEIFRPEAEAKSYVPYVKIEFQDGRKQFAASTQLEVFEKSLFNEALPLVRQLFYDPAEPDSLNQILWGKVSRDQSKLELSLVSDIMNADRIYLTANVSARVPEKMSAELSADVYVPGTDDSRKIQLTQKPIELSCSKVRVKN